MKIIGTKKLVLQMVLAMAVPAMAAQTSFAQPLSFFNDGTWIQIADDDGVGDLGFVDPGWGGQDFDAEYLFYRQENNTLLIGLQTGFNVTSGVVTVSGHDYYAGDLALSFDGDSNHYEYAYDFGLYTEDYEGNAVGAGPLAAGTNAPGLYAVDEWNNNIYFSGSSSPYAMENGTLLETGTNYSGYDSDADSYWQIISFDITSLGLPYDFTGFTAHWTMSCGNDVITGSAPVPEPGTMLLFGLGLAGIAGISRKRLIKS